MPQLACPSGGEFKSKVACETAALPSLSSGAEAGVRRGTVPSAVAESVLLRLRDGGVGFVGLFGAALRRDGSTKGRSNPKAATAAGAARAGAPRAVSRRMMPPGEAAVVVVAVLPAGKVVTKERRAPRRGAAGARVFASEAVAAAEPVSPKVSCFGAVRSERRLAPPEKQEEESGGCWSSVTATVRAAPPEKQEEERRGYWASVTAAVRSLCWNNDPRVGEPEASESSSNSMAATAESPPNSVLSPPRLGDVKRLASRRWVEIRAGEGPGLV